MTPPSLPEPKVARPLGLIAPPPDAALATGEAPRVLECAQCRAALTPDDLFCGECGLVTPAAIAMRPAATRAVPTAREATRDEPGTSPGPPAPADGPPATVTDAELARALATHRSRAVGARFVLQFSTGESRAVTGSGLIGRKPRPEPGERFDALIEIIDPTRSVSKTHLEFGQDEGEFWVSDRYSANGTVVRAPEAAPQRLHPERRYRLERGTRVDMGEQFFVVS